MLGRLVVVMVVVLVGGVVLADLGNVSHVLLRLGLRLRLLMTYPLATAMLLLVRRGVAQTSPLLLVPSAQRLAAEHEVIVLDDGGLDPALGGEVDFPSVGIHGADVGNNVVVLILCR